MQAFEFQTTAHNGFIKIPDKYAKKIGSEIRVIVLPKASELHEKPTERRSLLDLIGVFKGCSDMDAKEIREERLRKYEITD
jgi:hypothetical protein